MFQVLREANFIIKLKKCNFIKQKLRFLKHIISKDEIKINLAKMILLLLPTNLKQL